MKKVIKLLGLSFALAALFAGCDMDPDWGNSNNSGNQPDAPHVWSATDLYVKTPDAKVTEVYNVILTGEYSLDDFKVEAFDDYYLSLDENYSKDVSKETTLSVNGKVLAENEKFTVELGANYKLILKYKEITKEYEFVGNKLGSFVPTEETFKELEGIKFGEIKNSLSSIKIVETYKGFLGDSLSVNNLKIEKLNTENYSIFVGPDKDNLTKVEGNLDDYAFKATDKIFKVYGEKDLSSSAAATTLPHTISLTINSLSTASNAMFALKSVTSGVETRLLSLVAETTKISIFEDVDSKSAKLGSMKILDSEGKIRSGLTITIHATKDCSDAAVATLSSSTTAEDKWTPGDGLLVTEYGAETTINGKIYHSKPKDVNKYFLKAVYNDGKNSFTSKNIYKIDEDGKEYPYIQSSILVNTAE